MEGESCKGSTLTKGQKGELGAKGGEINLGDLIFSSDYTGCWVQCQLVPQALLSGSRNTYMTPGNTVSHLGGNCLVTVVLGVCLVSLITVSSYQNCAGR